MNPKTHKPVPPLPECRSCQWFRKVNETARCHGGPPQIRLPFDNMAAWPVVPIQGGGCRLWEPVRVEVMTTGGDVS